MRTIPLPEGPARRLATPLAARRLAFLAIWRDLQVVLPGLAQFDLGTNPEAEIKRNVATLRLQHERDISADVAEWLRASDAERVRHRRRVRAMLPRVRALRDAQQAIFRLDSNSPPPPAAALFDIVNQGLSAPFMQEAA